MSPSPSGSRNGEHPTRCTSEQRLSCVTSPRSTATSSPGLATSSWPSCGRPTSRPSLPTCAARSDLAPRDRSTGSCELRSTPPSTLSCWPAPPPAASSCPKHQRPTWSPSAPRSSTAWRRLCRTAGNPWCACGLRFSEVAGLRVGRVDAAQRRLQVIETAPQVGGDRAEPKTAAGRRTVPLPGLVAEILGAHLGRYGLAGETDALVLSAARGGRLHAANWHKRAWVPARRAAGLPTLRFHDLRHSAVCMPSVAISACTWVW
ncbi:MAG TPA: tyrosine-type recombinase/integrase [Acidimicrobiales bacterium]|nr:tyrosine-type recombinase/integrase [Acidimicrobiales bacterium]